MHSQHSVLFPRLSALLPLFVFLALLSNIFVVYYFEKSREPQIIYCVRPQTNDAPASVSSTSPVPLPSSIVRSSKPSSSSGSVQSLPSVSVHYHYFMAGGNRHVQMWNRYFSEGSLTSYGRIINIFPDRILLEDGSYIVNSTWKNAPTVSTTNSTKLVKL